jgi:hypothetical protein
MLICCSGELCGIAASSIFNRCSWLENLVDAGSSRHVSGLSVACSVPFRTNVAVQDCYVTIVGNILGSLGRKSPAAGKHCIHIWFCDVAFVTHVWFDRLQGILAVISVLGFIAAYAVSLGSGLLPRILR